MRIPFPLVLASLLPACSAPAPTGDAPQANGAMRAEAASPAKRRGGGWRRADRDGDGAVTRAEVTAEADARFARLDADGNGRLTGDERTAAMRRRADAGAEGDAAVTAEALRAQALARFGRFDRDGDGRLAGDELGRGGRRRGTGGRDEPGSAAE